MGIGVDVTEMDEDFPKVIGMARNSKQPSVTDSLTIVRAPKAILLRIAHRLDSQPDRVHHHSSNVPPRPKPMLRVARHSRRVEHRDRQRNGPDPEHLKEPEAEKGEEPLAHLVKAIIFACFEDAEEEERREADGPGDEEEGGDELAGLVVVAEGECCNGEDDEVGAAGEV